MRLPALLVLGILGLATLLTAERSAAQDVPRSRAEIAISFAPVVRTAAPAVVNVHSARQIDRRSLFGDDPFLRHFFRGPRSRQRGSALGSGVVVDPEGLVVTNAHVIRNAREIRVSFNDKREYPATLLLKDERTDLAILEIASDETFPHLSLGDPSSLEVGDLVLAIGNPFGVGQTVTQGIVSALARTQVGVADSRFFIQTDAAINPGNSGGALVDMAGRLVGINTAIYTRSGGSNGIGFAIPTDMVRLVVDSARNGGKVQRPWLGARLTNVTRDLARQLGLDRPVGAVVTQIVPGSPAERAGLGVADVITHVDGMEVSDRDGFGYLFATRGIEGDCELTLVREGKERVVRVALEVPPERPPRDARRMPGRSPFGGAIVMNLSPAVADELNLDLATDGVAVARVDPRSVAERVGLKAGDIVRIVNGWRIENTRMLERIASQRQRYWDVVIERDGEQLSLVLGG
jgi:Do/DeqQ family serine protease